MKYEYTGDVCRDCGKKFKYNFISARLHEILKKHKVISTFRELSNEERILDARGNDDMIWLLISVKNIDDVGKNECGRSVISDMQVFGINGGVMKFAGEATPLEINNGNDSDDYSN